MRNRAWIILFLSMLVRVALALAVPLDGDEVYYASWGLTPKLMYTDHPPITGWIYALVHLIWNQASVLSLRMPWLLCMTALGVLLIAFHDKKDSTRPSLLFHSHLLTYVPIFRADHLIIVWITLAVFLFVERRQSAVHKFFLIPLSLVPLTKYLGVLALPPWGRWLTRKQSILAVTAVALTGIFILAANALTGWRNLEFTFGGRFSGHLSSLYGGGLGTFALALILGCGPLLFLFSDRNLWRIHPGRDRAAALLTQSAASYCGALALFALLTAKFQSAWIVPGVFLFLLGQAVRESPPHRTLKWIVGLQAALVVTACGGVAAFKAGAFDSKIDPARDRAYLIALYQEPRAFSRWLNEVRGDTLVMTEGIAEAALLKVFLNSTIAVYPTGYHWFRDLQDHQNLDFYAGKAVTYLALSKALPPSLIPRCPEGWRPKPANFQRYLVPLAQCPHFK